MRGKEGKREEINGISHLPAAIQWGSVCSRQHVCAQRGHRTFVCLCLCVWVWPDGDGICRETPRQTDSWPGRQKNRQGYKWLKWVEIVWTGLYNVFPAEQLLIQFWQTQIGQAKIQRPDTVKMSIMELFWPCVLWKVSKLTNELKWWRCWILEVRDRCNVSNTPLKSLIRQVELALPPCASHRGTYTTLLKTCLTERGTKERFESAWMARVKPLYDNNFKWSYSEKNCC